MFSAIKNGTGVTLSLSSNIIGDSNNENNFHHKLFWLIHKFQSFIKHLQIILWLI